ncbi:MAG TPA: hypothetical protein VMH04_12075 [Candidatus Solibacter sp.]|nr:hypothetical protein [Candidatus Solibacter sp.]
MTFPTLQPEIVEVKLQFAVQLRDGYTDSDQLLGKVTVASGPALGEQKDSSGTFLFYDLKAGAQVLTVTSAPETPYYLPAQVAVTVPMPAPLWPAFPDITAADPTLPLSDAGQKPAYKAQRQAATLLPTTAYPFSSGATLIRGTVLHNQQPVAAAKVRQAGGTDPSYTTGADGAFVLYLSNPPALPLPVTVSAQHAALGSANGNVTVLRGLTVSLTIQM